MQFKYNSVRTGQGNQGLSMNILVYEAGAVGTLDAARLQDAGHRVTILDRASKACQMT